MNRGNLLKPNKQSGSHGFVLQNKQVCALQFHQSCRPAIAVEKFNLKGIRREHLDHRANLPGNQAFRRLVFKQRNDIEQFYRNILHNFFIARNK